MDFPFHEGQENDYNGTEQGHKRQRQMTDKVSSYFQPVFTQEQDVFVIVKNDEYEIKDEINLVGVQYFPVLVFLSLVFLNADNLSGLNEIIPGG